MRFSFHTAIEFNNKAPLWFPGEGVGGVTKMSWMASVGFPCPTIDCENWIVALVGMPDDMSENDEVGVTGVGECDNCGETHAIDVTWLNGEATGAVVGHPETPTSVRVADWDFELDLDDIEPPDDPFNVFSAAQKDLSGLMAWYANHLAEDQDRHWVVPTFHEILPRMALMQHFAILEAYLADCLISLAERDPKVTAKLLDHADEFKQTKFSLARIFAEPDLVKKTMRETLRDVHFHNFTKADALFRIATGVSILPDTADKEVLLRAVNVRHDVVHRAGVDKEGNRHEDLGELIIELQRIFTELARRAEDAVRDVDFQRGLRVLSDS